MSDKVIIRNAAGDTVRTSQNLRGIIRHAGQHGVKAVRLSVQGFSPVPTYSIEFANGDQCNGAFADPGIMVEWFVSRSRRWAVEWLTIEASVSRGSFWLSSMTTLARHFTMVSPITYVLRPREA